MRECLLRLRVLRTRRQKEKDERKGIKKKKKKKPDQIVTTQVRVHDFLRFKGTV